MKEREHSKRKIGVILFVLLLGIIFYISMRGSYLEYKELGENFVSVLTTNLKYKYTIMAINFIILFIVVFLFFVSSGESLGSINVFIKFVVSFDFSLEARNPSIIPICWS